MFSASVIDKSGIHSQNSGIQGRRQGVCLGRAKALATAAPALKKVA